MKKQLFVALMISVMMPGLALAMDQMDRWLSVNEPRVISYLKKLDASDIGKKLPGALLSDGNMELEGYSYAGHVGKAPKGAHIYLFHYDGADVAYIWVDAQGTPLELPICNEDDPRTQLPGWGGATISGDAYIDSEVQPGGHVVITHCVPLSWLKGKP